MARSFRLYEKKRGNRRTGSKWFGSLGEALFFAVLFFVGCVGLVFLLATAVIPEWRVNHAFVQTTATVLKRQGAEAWVRFRTGGEVREVRVTMPEALADEAANPDGLGRFAVGAQCPCWYDPANPDMVVLARGYTWWLWLALSVPISFLLIGGGGLIYTVLSLGKSMERRAARVARNGLNGRAHMTGALQASFPNVPSADQITDSPGTELAYRLPMAGSPAWTLGLWLTACLLWNGTVSGFAVVAVHGLLARTPDWVLIGFLVPFLIIGIALIVVFIRQLVVATAIGPTLLEISEQPLHPGGSYDVLLWQSGRLRLSWLEVLLACDEEATYRHGTNTRNESHRVYQQSVFRRDAGAAPQVNGSGARFDAQREPFTVRFTAAIPEGAMHSFKSEHNSIDWKLIVRGRLAGWPDFERSFPVIVRPHASGVDPS